MAVLGKLSADIEREPLDRLRAAIDKRVEFEKAMNPWVAKPSSGDKIADSDPNENQAERLDRIKRTLMRQATER